MKTTHLIAALAASMALAVFGAEANAKSTTAAAQGTTQVQAEIGDTVYGARGSELGTVAGTDSQGRLQVETEDGTTVTIAPALLTYNDGKLSAPTTSPADLEAMAGAGGQGDQDQDQDQDQDSQDQ